jgi:hypothetical protein
MEGLDLRFGAVEDTGEACSCAELSAGPFSGCGTRFVKTHLAGRALAGSAAGMSRDAFTDIPQHNQLIYLPLRVVAGSCG